MRIILLVLIIIELADNSMLKFSDTPLVKSSFPEIRRSVIP